jgi:hypothetical protein
MVEETYTDVLRGASEDLIKELNHTPQRYIPAQTLGCMVSLCGTINPCDEDKKERVTSKDIEGDAKELINSLDVIKSHIPESIQNCIKNLQIVLKTHAQAS